MLSEYEAARLQRDMRAELEDTTGALVKSAVGLLVVVLLALLSPTLEVSHDEAASGRPANQAAMERRL